MRKEFTKVKGSQDPFTKKKKSVKSSDKMTKRGTERKGGYVGGFREKAKLSWDESVYTLRNLQKKAESEVRKEYSRLRSIIRKRLDRMGKTEYKSSPFYQKYKDYFKPLAKITDNKTLRHLVVELSRILLQERSSVSGMNAQRDRFLKSINREDSPYKGIVNESNYLDFLDFMETMREVGIINVYDSDQVVEFFQNLQAQNKKLGFDELQSEFYKWKKNKETPVQKWVNRDKVSSSDVIKVRRQNGYNT